MAKSGGTITIDSLAGFTIYRNNGVYSAVHFYNTQDGNMTDVGYLGAASDGRPVYLNSSGSVFDLIHSGNIGQQSVNYSTRAGAADSANEAYRFRTIASVVNQLIDLNTECLGGGLVRNYAGPSYWKNAPDGLAYGMVLTIASGFSSTLQGQLAWDVNHASTVDTTRKLWWRANDQTDFANSKWHQIAFTDSNVASATKLQTARTIWGQSFDGTGNVSGDIQSDNIIPTASGSYTLGTAENQWYAIYSIRLHSRAGSDLYIGANNDNNIVIKKNGNVAIGGTTADARLHVHGNERIDGELYINNNTILHLDDSNTWVNYGGANDGLDLRLCGRELIFQYGRGDAFTRAMTITSGGNVAIGGTTADAKLHVHGDILATGSVTSNSNFYGLDFCTTSDNRLKDFTKDVEIDFENLKNIPKKYYYWKDKSMGEDLQIGTSAQELIKIYPECVSYNEKDDKYSVNYQKLSIVALAAIDKLHDRVKYLESKLND